MATSVSVIATRICQAGATPAAIRTDMRIGAKGGSIERIVMSGRLGSARATNTRR
jgi:ribosomal protein S3